MKRRNIIIGSVLAVLFLVWIFNRGDSGEASSIKVTVKKGLFEVTVTTTGELKAKESKDIKGPEGMRSVGIYRVAITKLIPEGTLVKEGDIIGELDRTEISTKLSDLSSELQKIESQFIQIKLDTTLELREFRDNLINLNYGMEEKKLILEQSKYEPPATIRQAEIDLDKAVRAYTQAKENYKLKVRQAKAKIKEIAVTMSKQQSKFDRMEDLVGKFTIKAPMGGMLIYIRDWNGKKKEVGSQISSWDPSVATLPDLSVMISKTYVNEVEIRKVKKNQTVEIGVDAFPEKMFTGKVIEIANVGEQKPNSDAKVFEVIIQINESDTLLRPAMTTSNIILADVQDSVLYLPLEAVHSRDSITFVYRSGSFRIFKQEVTLGLVNENEVVISSGLEEKDEVYLSVPENGDDLKLVKLDAGKP